MTFADLFIVRTLVAKVVENSGQHLGNRAQETSGNKMKRKIIEDTEITKEEGNIGNWKEDQGNQVKSLISRDRKMVEVIRK